MLKKLLTKAAVLAILEIVVGILCLVMGQSLIHTIVLIFGIGLIAYGVITLVSTKVENEIIYGVAILALGIVLVIASAVFESVVIYLFAIVFILYGVTNLVLLFKNKVKIGLIYIRPLLQLLVGILLIVEKAATLNVLMYIAGIMLIVVGVFDLLVALNKIKLSKKIRKAM